MYGSITGHIYPLWTSSWRSWFIIDTL